MPKYKILIFLFLFCHRIGAQSDLRIEDWKAHLPYQRGTSVTQSQDKIIYSTPWSLIIIDKEDLSASFLSKVDGLSDIGIEKVRYDSFNNQLFIIYSNSNIDIIKEQDVINISNIKSNTTIAGNKKINDIHFKSQSESYFATEFGIIEFNNLHYNFGSTILTGIGIRQITTLGNVVYAASSEGVYYIDKSIEGNIADFNRWEILGTLSGLPSLYDARTVVSHQGHIFIGTIHDIYKSSNSQVTWSLISSQADLELKFMNNSDDRLIVGWQGENFQSKITFIAENDDFILSGTNCTGDPVEAIRDEYGRIWYADRFDKIRFSASYMAPCSQTSYNSPYSENASDIKIKEGNVLIASGGVAENFTFLFSREGFYFLENNTWRNFNEVENFEISQFELLSVFRVAFHPSLAKFYAGSYWAGLLEYDQLENNYTLYNKTNSSIRGAIGDPERERITGLAFDNDENLWIATYGAASPINVLTNDGRWQSLNVPSPSSLTNIEIDESGYKWFPVDGNDGGVLVYDSGSSIQSTADDRYKFINRNNSEITSNIILSVKVDLDGAVWVGTNEGPVIFDCGGNVFDDDCQGVRRKVLQDSIVAFLLADQQINVIEVDGANRKWFGTRNGIFVQSPQGEEQIAHFNSENSPLFGNEISALSYNGTSGEMWIGTNKGILVFRTPTTLGGRIHQDERVYAFPNPVDPGYKGPIAIKGLVVDANVKITDVNGVLVTELTALGGQAIWNGKDLKGRDVTSGVYLVFSSDAQAFDRPDSFVTKIMVLR